MTRFCVRRAHFHLKILVQILIHTGSFFPNFDKNYNFYSYKHLSTENLKLNLICFIAHSDNVQKYVQQFIKFFKINENKIPFTEADLNLDVATCRQIQTFLI